MNRYNDFDIQDFIEDDFFCQWVLNPTAQTNKQWQNWFEKNPEYAKKAFSAKEIILSLNSAVDEKIDSNLLEDTWTNIEKATRVTKSARLNWWKISVAASVALVLGWFVFSNITDGQRVNHKIADSSELKWQNQFNDGTSVQRLTLDDGSIVTLEPGSELNFPKKFDGKTRSVTLKGEGFFEIAHNPEKPFYVYANETVIRVLGTSFFVKAKASHEDVEVIVKTGKVEVFKRKDIQELQRLPKIKIKSLKVTPNQKVVFNRKKEVMSKRITPSPVLVKPIEELPKLKFNNAPASEIFKAISEAYGIEISFKPEAVIDCPLTTTLNERNLFEKLDIICKPLGLAYHEHEARIIISGNCRR